MYFPTSAARRLSSVPPIPSESTDPVIALCPNSRKTLFCTVTSTSITLWRIRPCAVLAHLARTPTSVSAHGENAHVEWSPDSRRIVIQTTGSFLVLITVEYNAEDAPYQPPVASNAQRHFLPGPGEALPFQSASLQLEGVIRVEGNLLSISPRTHYILYSTKNPPTVQRIPWPIANDDEDGNHPPQDFCDSWIINDHELPWLMDSDVFISKISFSKHTGVETWITSDGRAYLVQLYEDTELPPSTSDFSTLGDDSQHVRDLYSQNSID